MFMSHPNIRNFVIKYDIESDFTDFFFLLQNRLSLPTKFKNISIVPSSD